MSEKEKASKPGFTRVDNYFLDHVMPRVTGAQWKVVCAVLRETIGWDKVENQISIERFMEMTGCERQAVVVAVRKMLVRGAIERQAQQRGRQRTFRFKAGQRGNLKELPPAEPRRQQSHLPFDVLRMTEYENQTPMTPSDTVENVGQNATKCENQTSSRSMKIKLRSGLTECENQTPIESCPNNVFKERSLTTERSLTKEIIKNAVAKSDRDTETVEKAEAEIVHLCRFCQSSHEDPLQSPAVTLYYDRFKLMPNEGFRHDIWLTVQDLLLWTTILEGWWYTNNRGKRVEKNPLAVKQMLNFYDTTECLRRKSTDVWVGTPKLT